MGHLHDRAEKIKLRYKLAFIFVVGLLAAHSMPPSHLVLCMFVGLSTLYLLVATTTSNAQAFSVGYFFGLGYFGLGLYWIGNALLVEGNPYWWAWPLAITGLPALLSFFPAFACYSYRKYLSGRKIYNYLGFVALMAISEWLRGNILTGFPWNLYGYTWANILPVVQTVSFSDIYFLTLLTIFWSSAPGYLLISQDKQVMKYGLTFLAVALFVFLYQFGAERLAQNPTEYDKRYALALVQPNIPQNEKWDSERMLRNFEKHLALSKFVPSDNFSSVEATYIIWPETALARFSLEKGWALTMISDMLKTYPQNAYLISGALRYEQAEDSYYNSIVLLDQNAQILNTYNKNHLVPFGEYIPYGESLGIAPVVGFKGFQTGNGYRTDTTPEGLQYLPLVCYEIIFPNTFISAENNKSDVIINVTNDGWYGVSPGPYQHLVKAMFRAVETGIPVIRSANTGFTSAIDPYGRILERSELFQDAVIKIYLPQALVDKVKDGYTSIRSCLFFVSFLLLLLSVVCKAVFYKQQLSDI